MGFYQFKRELHLKANQKDLWEFISSPENLKKITPPAMGFDITSELPKNGMYQGMIISYTVKPLLNIKTTWVTEITHIKEGVYFVDEQRVGPYSMWHHEHIIEPTSEGCKMFDIVSYKPPFGILGSIANTLFIEKKLSSIFDFRESVLTKRWPIIKENGR